MKDYLIIKDNGAALIISMMILIMLNIIGLAAISTTSTEISIAGNERMNAQALQAAEAGIREVIYRMGLTSDDTATIVNGGSQVAINGITNAYIGDAGVPLAGEAPITIGNVTCTSANPCPASGWEYKVFFANNPTSGGAYTATATILPSSEWTNINYSETSTANSNTALTVRYMTENDLGADQNGDGDAMDIVYYNPATDDREVIPSASATYNIADVIPPATLPKDYAIMLITSIGRAGSAQKRVTVEVTSFPVDINVGGGVSAGVNINMTGNAFVSGFNHDADTQRSDETTSTVDDPFYWNNNRDNWNRGTGPNADDETTAMVDYAGMIINDPNGGHVPGAITTTGEVVTSGGSQDAWGDYNCGVNCRAWKSEGSLGADFPELYQLLGVDETVLNQILAKADVTNANASSPAQGITYIDNSGGQIYTPAGTDGWGLMVVTGDFKAQANYEFRGLIYVQGNAEMRGGFWLLGAAAVKGTSELKFAAGTPTVLYSSGALDRWVKRAIKDVGFAFTTLSWREG